MQGRHNGILIDDKPVQAPKFLIVRQFIARSERKHEMTYKHQFRVKKGPRQEGPNLPGEALSV
jgi:hypothetical protein